MSPSTVLVTGARRFIGGQLAARLADDPMIVRVLAVEAVRPPKSCRGDEMLMGEELARHDERDERRRHHAAARGMSGVADGHPSGREIHWRGVWGEPEDQAVFAERDEPNGIPALGYPENAAEVEGYIVVSFGAARMLPSQAAPTGAAPTGWKALATPLAAPQAVESAELAVHELRRYRDLADLRHF
jgi:hypothetical protein